MPIFLSNAAVTSSPSTNLSENGPSKIKPHLQEGLFSVSKTSFGYALRDSQNLIGAFKELTGNVNTMHVYYFGFALKHLSRRRQ
jgi:hypothetical protein